MLQLVNAHVARRGPRLAALAWLLRTAAHDPTAIDYINAVVRGYREHIQLTDEELESSRA